MAAPCCPCVPRKPGAGCACRPTAGTGAERENVCVPHALRYLPAAASPPSRSAVPSPARPAPLRAGRRRHGQRRDVTAGATGRRRSGAEAGPGLLPWLCGGPGAAPLALRRVRGLRGCPGSASPPCCCGGSGPALVARILSARTLGREAPLLSPYTCRFENSHFTATGVELKLSVPPLLTSF